MREHYSAPLPLRFNTLARTLVALTNPVTLRFLRELGRPPTSGLLPRLGRGRYLIEILRFTRDRVMRQNGKEGVARSVRSKPSAYWGLPS